MVAKKILITGAEGFIGSHVTELFVKAGYQVRATCLYNSFGNEGWLNSLPPSIYSEIEVLPTDIRDSFAMMNAIKGIDIVVHLAALIAIPYSYHAPDSYVDTNIRGTLNILNAVRTHSCEQLLVTSTSEVYGTAQIVPISETHPLNAQSPYAATKIGADQLALSYHKSFGTPVTVVRPFNTYGPRQSMRAIIPTILVQALSSATEITVGKTSPTRDLLYVKDTAAGFLDIAKSKNGIGEVTNLGTGQEISIADLIHKIQSLLNTNKLVKTSAERLRPDKSEVERLCANATKAHERFNWKPRTSLESGLHETIEWFKDPKNLAQYTSNRYVI